MTRPWQLDEFHAQFLTAQEPLSTAASSSSGTGEHTIEQDTDVMTPLLLGNSTSEEPVRKQPFIASSPPSKPAITRAIGYAAGSTTTKRQRGEWSRLLRDRRLSLPVRLLERGCVSRGSLIAEECVTCADFHTIAAHMLYFNALLVPFTRDA